jgi:hypothetical protein
MGGNLVLRWAGEVGANPPGELKAVVGISPLMDLAASSAALHRVQNRLYERHFLRSMIARVRRRMTMYPAIYANAALDRIHTMREFDHHIVARYGGFADADDYYHTVASSRYAGTLRVPALIVHSLDDPFIRMLPQTREALIGNPHVTFLETQHGGHCAFLAPGGQASGDGYWAEKTLLGFLTHEDPERAGGAGASVHGS